MVANAAESTSLAISVVFRPHGFFVVLFLRRQTFFVFPVVVHGVMLLSLLFLKVKQIHHTEPLRFFLRRRASR